MLRFLAYIIWFFHFKLPPGIHHRLSRDTLRRLLLVLFDDEVSSGGAIVVVELIGAEMEPAVLVVMAALAAQGPLATTALVGCTEPVSSPGTDVVTPIAGTAAVVDASTEASTATASGTVVDNAQNEVNRSFCSNKERTKRETYREQRCFLSCDGQCRYYQQWKAADQHDGQIYGLLASSLTAEVVWSTKDGKSTRHSHW